MNLKVGPILLRGRIPQRTAGFEAPQSIMDRAGVVYFLDYAGDFLIVELRVIQTNTSIKFWHAQTPHRVQQSHKLDRSGDVIASMPFEFEYTVRLRLIL